ncbi:uncharacterized protein LOC114805486 [Ornithorhynchus anatinus]|uniref:uncharacterized protein LOC114805486 n=1 Tax=Ornithorhynchus anatinus TaxID=9258 RepID=UPI0010A7A38C|nr:uncharacterized protein LOC114805486 [Ornithorhynchus anatinus]
MAPGAPPGRKNPGSFLMGARLLGGDIPFQGEISLEGVVPGGSPHRTQKGAPTDLQGLGRGGRWAGLRVAHTATRGQCTRPGSKRGGRPKPILQRYPGPRPGTPQLSSAIKRTFPHPPLQERPGHRTRPGSRRIQTRDPPVELKTEESCSQPITTKYQSHTLELPGSGKAEAGCTTFPVPGSRFGRKRAGAGAREEEPLPSALAADGQDSLTMEIFIPRSRKKPTFRTTERRLFNSKQGAFQGSHPPRWTPRHSRAATEVSGWRGLGFPRARAWLWIK